MKFTQTAESKVFFTSDPHFSHKNICAGVTTWVTLPENFNLLTKQKKEEFCKLNGLRNFRTIDEMNSTILNRINEKVGENDILFILGDVGFGGKETTGKFMSQLVCKNVHLIYGNHDKYIERNEDGLQGYFKSCSYLREITVDNQRITLCHYAMRVWNKSHRGAWQLYGHSHGSLPDDSNALSIDVGVDTNDMYPYSFDDIKRIMEKKNYKSIDHHRE